MKKVLMFIAALCVGFVSVLIADPSTPGVLISGSKTETGPHTKAIASYSIVREGEAVKIQFTHSTTSNKGKGGGRGVYHLMVFDPEGNQLVNKRYSDTIGSNRFNGRRETKGGSDSIDLFGEFAANFAKRGGTVALVVTIDRTGDDLPQSFSDLKKLVEKVGGDFDGAGILVKTFSGLL